LEWIVRVFPSRSRREARDARTVHGGGGRQARRDLHRKSTSAGLEQEFNSLDAQREACADYAKRQGWTVVATYDDGGFTGANIDRPAFQRLLADVDAGKLDVIVVYKVDRLSRSLLDFARVLERFNGHNVSFVSVTQNFSTADAMGKLTLNMLMSFAEFEREMIAERTRDKIVAARRKGKWTGGAVPVGYYAVERKLVRSASEALVIREVFDLYESHGSVLGVVRDLHARGRKRRKGEWTKDAVRRVLSNPLYAGLISAAEELHRAEHEAIVPREQFERVRQMLAGHAARPPRPGKNPAYLLRGLLYCGVCCAAMTPSGSRAYRYYRCVTRDKLGTKACSSRPLRAQAVEAFVVERVHALATNTAHIAELQDRMRARFGAEKEVLSAQRAALPARIGKLSADAQAFATTLARVSGRAQRIAEEKLLATAAALDRAQAELQEVEGKVTALNLAAADAEWIRDALSDFAALWELMTPLNRQRLVAAIVDRVDVNEAAGQMTVKLAAMEAA
jgi:DNA invertase Pin-like site-specific DNA recombinase